MAILPERARARMEHSCEIVQTPVGHRPLDGPLLDAWFELNYRLQEEAFDTNINIAFVEQWMVRLWMIVSPGPQCFWLFLARINELALLCASKYMDCCDFAAADELLVEPCSFLSRVDEVGVVCRDRRGRTGALLPCLYDLLKGSGYITEDYLRSVSRRTEKIVQVAAMFAVLGIGDTEDFSMMLSLMDVDQRRDFQSRLCLFDRETFNEIGRALHLFMLSGKADDKYVGKYLRG